MGAQKKDKFPRETPSRNYISFGQEKLILAMLRPRMMVLLILNLRSRESKKVPKAVRGFITKYG